jgi:hypothetical protein
MGSIYGTIRNIEDQKGVPGASIEILDSLGQSLGGKIANANGAFAVNVGPNDKLRFSSVGYTTSTLPASYFVKSDGATVYLFPDATLLPGVTVTPKKSNLLIWILAAAVVAKVEKII